MPGKYTFSKNERLCSQKAIQQLFAEGKSLYYFPFRLVYFVAEKSDTPVRIVISVPKRNFKRAVKRNLLKRRLREAYRKYKPVFYTQIPSGYTINIMLIYVSSTIASYAEIEAKLAPALSIVAKHIEKNIDFSAGSIN